MSRQSKRTSAPAPQAGPPLGSQAALPLSIPSVFGFGPWCPPNSVPQATASSSANCPMGLQEMGSSSTQVPWWTSTSVGVPYTHDPQAWGADFHPPGGFSRLEDVEPDKRKFEEDIGEQFSLEHVTDERPIGGKKAKEQQKRKRKDEACIIDLEGELTAFVEAQNKANESRKEMLETQKRVSSEKLEAQKLAYLAAKENKEAGMLEAYRELLKQDTTRMAEDVRSEHVLALKCLRENFFGN